MKILKRIVIVLVAIVVIAAIIGWFMPAAVHVQRSMVLKATPEALFAQVNDLKSWNNWAPWNKMDKKMKITWGDKNAGEAASYSWESTNSNVGKGSMKISKSIPSEAVSFDMDFGANGKATADFKFEKSTNGTKATWSMDSNMGGNPFMHLMAPLMDKMLGAQFEKGLHDLDSVALSMPPANDIKVEMTTMQTIHYLAVRDTASVPTIGMKLGMYYMLIGKTMKKQNLKMAGAPFAIYYTESPTNWDMDAAISVDKPGKADGRVKEGEIKAGNVVVAHYYGAYEKTRLAYNALNEWMKTNNKKAIGAPWEVYITDPMVEKDTAKWLTNIFFPIE